MYIFAELFSAQISEHIRATILTLRPESPFPHLSPLNSSFSPLQLESKSCGYFRLFPTIVPQFFFSPPPKSSSSPSAPCSR